MVLFISNHTLPQIIVATPGQLSTTLYIRVTVPTL